MYGPSGRIAATSIALTVLACGDDGKTHVDQGQQADPGKPTAAARCSDPSPAVGGGIDAGLTPQTSPLDGSLLTVGAGAGGGLDASEPEGDAQVHCDVNDPRYGCGTALGPNWLRFEGGLEIDRRYERGWSPVFDVQNMTDLVARCAGLRMRGIAVGQFKVPAITDVRTLAGGCDNTVLGSSGCRVTSGTYPPAEAGTCSCDTCVGPNNGKFCLPDVPECVSLWTETICEGTPECPKREVWIYDVSTGAVGLSPVADLEQLTSVKGRCFAGLPAPIP